MAKERPNFPKDFAEFLTCFLKEKVEFVLVGAHAMAAWGYVRATGDLDILVVPSPTNAGKVFQALKRFGAPLKGVEIADFNSPGTVYQIGLPPLRIDILTEVDGLDSREAHRKAKRIRVAGVPVRVLCLDHLIQNKIATGREKDKLDAKILRKMKGILK